jgi:pyruvate, water dikinase
VDAVPLREASDPASFGGKAVQLGAALRSGLPVPDGLAIAADFVEVLVLGNASARARFLHLTGELEGPLAVRSSAIGEDSAETSFAGQHVTKLNVNGGEGALAALAEVWQSGRTESALAYRKRMGAGSEPQVGVVVQRLVTSDIAGVLFTSNPVTGSDEIIIEAAWGLGESVVQGMVIPDRFRMTRAGSVLERVAGLKTIAIRNAPNGGTWQEAVAPELARRLCLGYPELRSLHALASRCDEIFGREPHDLEWAFQAGQMFLLQRRPITRNGSLISIGPR